jgi:hypothetical protein
MRNNTIMRRRHDAFNRRGDGEILPGHGGFAGKLGDERTA